jgi:hypothetical protein
LNQPITRAAAGAPARRARAKAFVLERLRRSRVLRWSAMLAFLEYGALAILAIVGQSRHPVLFPLAGWLAVCSLGSWFFLFAWFPFLQNLFAQDTGDGQALRVGRALEVFAIGCVAVVHALLALILLRTV